MKTSEFSWKLSAFFLCLRPWNAPNANFWDNQNGLCSNSRDGVTDNPERRSIVTCPLTSWVVVVPLLRWQLFFLFCFPLHSGTLQSLFLFTLWYCLFIFCSVVLFFFHPSLRPAWWFLRERDMWSYHFSLLFLTVVRSSSYSPMTSWKEG